jgi:hypothetical protein
MVRSLGMAYNEVVVALLDEPRSATSLRHFAAFLTLATTLLLVTIAATPLAPWWFGVVSGLALPLVALASTCLWIALPLPGLNVLQSWYQGALVHKRRTRSVTEAMAVFLIITNAVLWAGVTYGQVPGLYVSLLAFGVGSLTQTLWLWYRSRPVMQQLKVRDADGQATVSIQNLLPADDNPPDSRPA